MSFEYDLIETDKTIIKVYRGCNYLEYIIRDDAIIDIDDAIRAKKEIVRLRPDTKFFVLTEGIGFLTITKEARQLAATREFSDNTHAIAFCTTNLSVALVGELYNKIYKPVVQTRIFNDKEKAKKWLIKLGANLPDSLAGGN